MAYLIDTNIAIHARDGTASVLEKLTEHDGSVVMSALSLAELQRGLNNDSPYRELRRARHDVLIRYLPVLTFDAAAATAYGRFIAVCGWVRGRDFDRMIAGHAISIGSILVTNDANGFKDVPGLVMENWV